jgi:hypothetical protein
MLSNKRKKLKRKESLSKKRAKINRKKSLRKKGKRKVTSTSH